uniref:probable aspartic proteinase GIP2 n=1 Tax=Erigeron canadensis TaxID=72917 RepID=UPI001CB93853|nr:probable aspartic proteinase GIP2 [Erigeron canadensis]
MASFFLPLFIITITFQINNSNGYLLLKVNKDAQTHQYTTQLLIGSPQLPAKLVVHLSGESIWVKCPKTSSSRNVIHHGSIPCLISKPEKSDKLSLFGPTTICEIRQTNPITYESGFGEVVQDMVSVDGFGSVGKFMFSCSSDALVNGLEVGSQGILGFGRSKIAFQNQIVDNFDISRSFVVCLSSSNGFIQVGASNNRITKSLSYTPLIKTAGFDGGYFVNVNSVNINGRKMVLGQVIGGVEISSVVPYTMMKSTIFEVFTRGYLRAAELMNMTRVAPVAPFGYCFESQEMVPDIELVLQSVFVKWKIQRRNSMVQVSDSVMCLGILDGGLGMNGLVVLGGYQLENRILEFNLGTSMMGFSSLLMEGNDCSNIRETVLTRKESLL